MRQFVVSVRLPSTPETGSRRGQIPCFDRDHAEKVAEALQRLNYRSEVGVVVYSQSGKSVTVDLQDILSVVEEMQASDGITRPDKSC